LILIAVQLSLVAEICIDAQPSFQP